MSRQVSSLNMYTYTYLYSKLNGKCCDNSSGQVYEIVKNLQKGIYVASCII